MIADHTLVMAGQFWGGEGGRGKKEEPIHLNSNILPVRADFINISLYGI
jgi:hypothetical protein